MGLIERTIDVSDSFHEAGEVDFVDYYGSKWMRAFVLSKENRRVPFAAYRSVFSSPRSTVDMLANRTSGLVIICSIAAHVRPCVSVQLAVAYHPSASATEYGYRADRSRDRAH